MDGSRYHAFPQFEVPQLWQTRLLESPMRLNLRHGVTRRRKPLNENPHSSAMRIYTLCSRSVASAWGAGIGCIYMRKYGEPLHFPRVEGPLANIYHAIYIM